MNQKGINTGFAAFALAAVALIAQPANAGTIDIYDGDGNNFGPLSTFFTGQGNTVNQLTTSFSTLAGANFVIISLPGSSSDLTAGQLTLLDNYVNGGGRLLINSEYVGYCAACITDTNAILGSLGSSIVNAATASVGGFHDTSDIVVDPFTTGVTDVNYADSSSLSGGTALVYGNPGTDDGQEFIAYEAIGSGYVFVIADSNTATNISSTGTNNNGTLYCNFGGLGCAATASTPEPTTVFLVGAGILSLIARRRRA